MPESKLERDIAVAEAKLDGNDFAGAAHDLRAVSLRAIPRRETLDNLQVAEEQDALSFRRRLVESYPSSIDMRKAYAHALLRARQPGLALRVCNEAMDMEGVTESPREIFLLRRLRLQAAILAGKFDSVVEDVDAIWAAGDSIPSADSFRRGVCVELVQIANPAAIESLSAIAERVNDANLSALLRAKIEELVALEKMSPPPRP